MKDLVKDIGRKYIYILGEGINVKDIFQRSLSSISVSFLATKIETLDGIGK